jgi:hypothetical protein
MRKRLLTSASVFAFIALLTMQAAAKEITVRGHLARTVEAGGWLIIADTDERTDKYLLLNPKRFQNESWFHVGAVVEVTGEIKRDAVTIYQEGIPFEARTMHLVGKASKAKTVNSERPPQMREDVVRQLDTAFLVTLRPHRSIYAVVSKIYHSRTSNLC